jgi:hypothetical protein
MCVVPLLSITKKQKKNRQIDTIHTQEGIGHRLQQCCKITGMIMTMQKRPFKNALAAYCSVNFHCILQNAVWLSAIVSAQCMDTSRGIVQAMQKRVQLQRALGALGALSTKAMKASQHIRLAFNIRRSVFALHTFAVWVATKARRSFTSIPW